MYSIDEFGPIIHEFDPWFNYRAAEYLAAFGLERFYKWYDYMSWYPLGRPVGTTIYPGIQLTAVWIHQLSNWLPPMEIKVPAYVRMVVPFLNQLRRMGARWVPKIPKVLTIAPIATMAVMSIIPAHLMRSVSGEFDNECVAIWSLCCTFWLWTRSIRTPQSWPWGIL